MLESKYIGFLTKIAIPNLKKQTKKKSNLIL